MEGTSMKRRKVVAVGFVALAALVFAIAAGGVSGATKAKSITVWLQTDAQAANWAPIVAAANAQFQKDTGATANVQYQSWGTHLQKFDADRKSTRLNSSHSSISYAVFCLKKKNK